MSEELSELLEFAAADFEPTQAEITDALATVRSLAGRSVTPLDAPLTPGLQRGELARRSPRRRGLVMVAAAAALALAVFAFQVLLPADQGGPAPVLAVGITPDGRNAFTIRAGEAPVLTPLPLGAQGASVSPDGSTIAYYDYVPGSSVDTDIYTLDITGGAPRVVSGGEGIDRTPSWSPDGSSISFLRLKGVSTDANGELICDQCSSDLMVVDVASGSVDQLSEGLDLNPSAPAWTQGGQQLAFIARDDDRLRVVGMDLSGAITLDHTCAQQCGSPSWSPEGSAVAFVEGGIGANPVSRIVVAAREEDQARDVTDGDVYYSDVAWSRDGLLAALGRDEDGRDGVYTVDPLSGQERRIADVPGRDWSVSWTKDGRILFQGSTADGPALFVVEPDGGTVERLI